MMPENRSKVTAAHLQRSAYVYIRQSTMRQVQENTESTRRQYDLCQKAVALGWARDQIVTVDCDLGQSGASAVDRVGFQRLRYLLSPGHQNVSRSGAAAAAPSHLLRRSGFASPLSMSIR